MTVETARPRLFITADCTACGACLLTCPERALRPGPGRPVVLDGCTGCFECIEICPANAITENDLSLELT